VYSSKPSPDILQVNKRIGKGKQVTKTEYKGACGIRVSHSSSANRGHQSVPQIQHFALRQWEKLSMWEPFLSTPMGGARRKPGPPAAAATFLSTSHSPPSPVLTNWAASRTGPAISTTRPALRTPPTPSLTSPTTTPSPPPPKTTPRSASSTASLRRAPNLALSGVSSSSVSFHSAATRRSRHENVNRRRNARVAIGCTT